MPLFQYAVIKHPTEQEVEGGEKDSLLVEVTTILADSESVAAIKAARAIPEAEADNLEQIEVVIRPF